jgi:Pyruvate/2-oxoacid:ferredoxin oxidoreductase delta subunit
MEVVRQEGADLAEMEEAVHLKNRGQFHRFEISRAVHEADLVINLPKLKTHGMMTLTGAVKNLFGCIPGRRKVQWHFNTGVNRDAFARMLVELSALIQPRLTIMDAVIGMDGNGPGSGDPFPVGVVLAGQDPVALDVVSGIMVGADPSLLYVVRAAAAAGIGETRLDHIKILGAALESVKVRGFRLPPQEHLEWRVPEWARSLLKDALTTRPVIDYAQCIRCGICQGHCPQGAIDCAAARFEINYRNCIRCFCCQEFCPQGAITVGRGWALKLVPSQHHR